LALELVFESAPTLVIVLVVNDLPLVQYVKFILRVLLRRVDRVDAFEPRLEGLLGKPPRSVVFVPRDFLTLGRGELLYGRQLPFEIREIDLPAVICFLEAVQGRGLLSVNQADAVERGLLGLFFELARLVRPTAPDQEPPLRGVFLHLHNLIADEDLAVDVSEKRRFVELAVQLFALDR